MSEPRMTPFNVAQLIATYLDGFGEIEACEDDVTEHGIDNYACLPINVGGQLYEVQVYDKGIPHE